MAARAWCVRGARTSYGARVQVDHSHDEACVAQPALDFLLQDAVALAEEHREEGPRDSLVGSELCRLDGHKRRVPSLSSDLLYTVVDLSVREPGCLFFSGSLIGPSIPHPTPLISPYFPTSFLGSFFD